MMLFLWKSIGSSMARNLWCSRSLTKQNQKIIWGATRYPATFIDESGFYDTLIISLFYQKIINVILCHKVLVSFAMLFRIYSGLKFIYSPTYINLANGKTEIDNNTKIGLLTSSKASSGKSVQWTAFFILSTPNFARSVWLRK